MNRTKKPLGSATASGATVSAAERRKAYAAKLAAQSSSHRRKPSSEKPAAAKSAQPQAPAFTLDDFEISTGPVLGEGKMGKVLLARHKGSKKLVALKCMSKKTIMDEGLRPQIVQEVEIHSRIRHRNVIRNFAYFQDREFVYFVLERANGGNLYEHWVASGQKVLDFLHSKGIIHRDIKPENLLLCKKKSGRHVLKLADFGWSVVKRETTGFYRTTLCGTLDYLSPEIVNNEEYDEAVDRWTLGVLMYEFLLGVAPFMAEDQESTFDRIAGANVCFPADATISEEAKDLIRQFLNPDAKARISLADAIRHPWIRRFAADAQSDAAADEAVLAKDSAAIAASAPATAGAPSSAPAVDTENHTTTTAAGPAPGSVGTAASAPAAKTHTAASDHAAAPPVERIEL